MFFIRRSFKDDEVYKLVLRHYVDTLIEKRFSLEWYVEGGRSRSGKLLPPRFGMLAYVVDAFRRGRSDDVVLIPTAICYDQISDVSDYAAEQQGAAKERESFFWFLRLLRRLGRRYGRIVVRFGEPLSLRQALGAPDPNAAPDPDERNLALQKLGFEVCVRINRATPITPISLVCLALLGRGDRALSVEEMLDALHNLVVYVRKRALPTSEPIALDTADGVRRTLDLLVESHLLERFDEGPDPVWKPSPDFSFTLLAGNRYIIGAVSDVERWDVVDFVGESQNGITSAMVIWTMIGFDTVGTPSPFWYQADAAVRRKCKRISSVGQLIDNALEAIEHDNPKLKGVLNRQYTQLRIDQAKLGELIDQIATIPFQHKSLSSKDILGHVYEYFLGQFALAEGKKGGQFYTPKSIVSLIVHMLEPFKGRVYDPAMGSGGFFVQSEHFISQYQGRIGDVSIYGQEYNHTTWQLAAMNMVIRGLDFNFGKAPLKFLSSVLARSVLLIDKESCL